jgi:hypothetical protein
MGKTIFLSPLLAYLCFIATFADASRGYIKKDASHFAIGAGAAIELSKPLENLPGLCFTFKNYLENKSFSFMSSLVFFPQIKSYKNQLDIGSKLNYNFLKFQEVNLHGALGPEIRINFDKYSDNNIMSLQTSISFSMEYLFSEETFLETAIENKFGFSHRPDIIFSFKIYRHL